MVGVGRPLAGADPEVVDQQLLEEGEAAELVADRLEDVVGVEVQRAGRQQPAQRAGELAADAGAGLEPAPAVARMGAVLARGRARDAPRARRCLELAPPARRRGPIVVGEQPVARVVGELAEERVDRAGELDMRRRRQHHPAGGIVDVVEAAVFHHRDGRHVALRLRRGDELAHGIGPVARCDEPHKSKPRWRRLSGFGARRSREGVFGRPAAADALGDETPPQAVDLRPFG